MVNPYEASREAYEPIIQAELVPSSLFYELTVTGLHLLAAIAIALVISAAASLLGKALVGSTAATPSVAQP